MRYFHACNVHFCGKAWKAFFFLTIDLERTLVLRMLMVSCGWRIENFSYSSETDRRRLWTCKMRWFRLNCLRVAISPAHSKQQRNASRMSGAHFGRADLCPSSGAKRRGYKFTKNANACEHIVPLRMVKTAA
uniref:Uncharacterized protein n=1 Tax=Trypanosoma vivax (strain Y486) TaxID=1055687 RepID=G0U7D2_TRYVY|nr:hypothetical protein, conserved in T. vivax [Trypanosoma vivax Y486]